MTEPRPHAVATVDISEEILTRMTGREPRLEIACPRDLLPTMRYPADFSGDPDFQRSPGQQAEFDSILNAADILYGIPDSSPELLARTIRSNPRLRWVHTMAAGGGNQVRAAQLTDEELRRVRFTTSAGVHGSPLAEFAVFGVLAGAKHLPRLMALKSARSWPERWFMGQV